MNKEYKISIGMLRNKTGFSRGGLMVYYFEQGINVVQWMVKNNCRYIIKYNNNKIS